MTATRKNSIVAAVWLVMGAWQAWTGTPPLSYLAASGSLVVGGWHGKQALNSWRAGRYPSS